MKQDGKLSRAGLTVPSMLGVLGFVLSVVSLGWQVHVHQESLTEKASVRFSISFLNTPKEVLSFDRTSKHRMNVDMDPSILKGKKNELSAEIINIGQHPLYVKSVRLITPCPEMGDSDSITFEPPKGTHGSLEPGAAITYKAGPWNFEEHPLIYGREQYCVTVESNKGLVAQTDHFSDVSFALSKESRAKLDKTPVTPH